MDALKIKYNEYLRLVGCHVIYSLDNGTKIDFTYEKENFIHLAGLHKLKDIQLIQFYNDKSNKSVKAKDVLRKIKNEDFTEAMIKGSSEFSQIEKRYNNLTYENLTSMSYTDAIIDFNPVPLNSSLKSNYLLFEQDGSGYNHLGIALDSTVSKRYIETFFYEPSQKYISGQTVVKIVQFSLYDSKGNLIVEDTF